MANGSKVSIQFNFETNDGEEKTLDVSAIITPFVPAVLNPVDHSHPDEGGDVEDITLILNGAELDLDDAIAMGLSKDRLEQAIVDAACDQEDDCDQNIFDDEEAYMY